MSEWRFFPASENQTFLQSAQRALGSIHSSSGSGFLAAARRETTWSEVTDRCRALKGRFTKLNVVGIGGSSLGAKVLLALKPDAQVQFWDHTDPAVWVERKNKVGRLEEAHWLWISKSGTTLETLAQLQIVDHWYKSQGLKLGAHSTVVTDAGNNPLARWATAAGVPRLNIPGDVGGRFSVLTPVGLLPAALAGINLAEVRKGVMSINDSDAELAQLTANVLASWARNEWTTFIWSYSEHLRPFVLWLQQLWAESLAKASDRHGSAAPRVSFPVPCVGSIDQHSILQQVVEGSKERWVWILRQEKFSNDEVITEVTAEEFNWLKGRTFAEIFKSQAEGTSIALRERGVSVAEWRWPKVGEFEIARALLRMQILIAALGECLDINTFNQPGVELGKSLTLKMLGSPTQGQ
jgi:glucose-6-phosphate isomerase